MTQAGNGEKYLLQKITVWVHEENNKTYPNYATRGNSNKRTCETIRFGANHSSAHTKSDEDRSKYRWEAHGMRIGGNLW